MPHARDREERLDAWLALAEDAPNGSVPIRLPMLSGSMRPAIPVGALIEVEKARGRDCRPGDVVVYRVDERLVAHRILWRFGRGAWLFFFEKGDTNDHGGWIRGSRIRGKVVAVLEGQERRPLLPDRDRACADRRALLRGTWRRGKQRLRDLFRGPGN